MPFFIFLYLVFNLEVKDTSISRNILISLPITYYAIRLTWNWAKSWEGLNDEDFRSTIRETKDLKENYKNGY